MVTYAIFYAIMFVLAMFTGLIIAHCCNDGGEVEDGTYGPIIFFSVIWPISLVGAVCAFIFVIFDLSARAIAGKLRKNFKK